jgi:hypothetical protein
VIVELRISGKESRFPGPAWNNLRDSPEMELSKDSEDKQKQLSNKLLLVKKTIIEIGSKLSRSKVLEYITENIAAVFEADFGVKLYRRAKRNFSITCGELELSTACKFFKQ